jgi:Recombination endonuclease VII
MLEKRCLRCGITKQAGDFYAAMTTRDRLQSSCKRCDVERNAIWQKRNPEKCRIKSNRWAYKKQYTQVQISSEDRQTLFNKQEGKCAICGRSEQQLHCRLAVEHCHNTNKIRGLLCGSCNRGLGLFQDNPDRLQKAAIYLKDTSKHKPQ